VITVQPLDRAGRRWCGQKPQLARITSVEQDPAVASPPGSTLHLMTVVCRAHGKATTPHSVRVYRDGFPYLRLKLDEPARSLAPGERFIATWKIVLTEPKPE